MSEAEHTAAGAAKAFRCRADQGGWPMGGLEATGWSRDQSLKKAHAAQFTPKCPKWAKRRRR
jgi:hypothetical protein